MGWAGLNCSFMQMYNMRDLILLDSNLNDTVFCNEKYATNIYDSNEVSRLNTNAGVLESSQICDVPYLEIHWFNKDAIMNIISLAHITDKFKVMMNSVKKGNVCLLVT